MYCAVENIIHHTVILRSRATLKGTVQNSINFVGTEEDIMYCAVDNIIHHTVILSENTYKIIIPKNLSNNGIPNEHTHKIVIPNRVLIMSFRTESPLSFRVEHAPINCHSEPSKASVRNLSVELNRVRFLPLVEMTRERKSK